MQSRRVFAAIIAGSTIFSFHASFGASVDFKMESKINYRNSDNYSFPVNFPFPPEALPLGQDSARLETVDEGSHIEISNIAFIWNWVGDNNVTFQAKVDAFDLYEKNPTSSDYDVSLDRVILRYGKKHTQGDLPEKTDFYIQAGKFGKFERQEDRHTESYGLVSTAFNRVEDAGFESGFDLSSGWYGKLSATTGNPVFMRDVNALAGDNGTDRNPPINFDPDLKVGIPILYDAEVERVNFSKPELGVALGYRWVSEEGDKRVNVMAFHYERDMAETVYLHGTFYGGDLDTLDLSEAVPGLSLPYTGDEKEETGVNLWWYGTNSSIFAQYVAQDVAGLKRDGWEIEMAYAFALEDFIGISRIIPVLRYSVLTSDFGGPSVYPSPSLWWDWTKLDVGFTLGFNDRWSVTTEYAFTDFSHGRVEGDNNELLMTLTWRYD